ncbi:lysylphosphatidylglycerol synthase domain-containing protein [Pseudogemmobacter sonorensis]|uniref:lysylphosphatidylglycerol synthase domain-containing protein n=1 Tax=Pseudogemmobacter sonorensis TaxID=2989681 RepID=UPI0036A568B4
MARIEQAPKSWKRFIWPVIGALAIVISFWLLARELRGISRAELWAGIGALQAWHWGLIALCTIGCYFTLALYDQIALNHLEKRLNFVFVALCSLTTYALAHNIGASAFTGAVIRYRAYSSKGLSGAEVGILVTFCSFTFSLGVMILLGVAFLFSPGLEDRFAEALSPVLVRWLAFGLLVLIGLYLLGSALGLRPLRIRSFTVSYPRLPVALQQITVAPVELLFAAGILYFALPDAGNPGYLVVMGVFVVAFALALLSHAPGGLGVFELAVLTALPEFEPEEVLAALIVFRLFYFILPLILSLIVVAIFEHGQLRDRRG